MTPLVTVGVPVWRGERHVAETLRSLQAQTLADFEAVIALDGPQPEAAARCRPFVEGDGRFRLVTHPERLGWVANVSWLMRQVRTPFWCMQPQDDLLDPRYLEVLARHAREAPEAAVVYCDIEAFGARDGVIVQPSVSGSAVGRQLALLADHEAAVAFRGLTRAEALRAAGGVPANPVEGFAADTAWMAAAARWGELRRVPGTLYRKRYHDANEHARWGEWPLPKRTRAWTAHCAAMLEQALLVRATAAERRLLWLAAAVRLVSPRLAGRHVPVEERPPGGHGALLDALLAEVAARGVDLPDRLEADPETIRHWADEQLG